MLRGNGSGRSLILNAHIDSVVPGPRELWDRDPWSADVAGGRLHGRGSWDDKVGVAAILWIVEALASARIRLRGDLIVQTVIDEEVSGNGTLACMLRGSSADAAIVVDGRGPGSAVIAHCGQLWFRVSATGKTAAAVDRWNGRNAIELLIPLIRAFRELESKATGPIPPFDGLEHPMLFNPGVIRGGDTPTTVPGTASLDCHLTFPAPWTVDDAKRIVGDTVASVSHAEGWPTETPPIIEFLSLQVPPFIAPPSDTLLSTIDGCQRRELGAPLVLRTISGFGDLRHFQLRGPMPCCMYGAGSGSGAHAANESLDLATVADAARVLATTVVEWCGTA
jgi:acetylornithine deacetylase